MGSESSPTSPSDDQVSPNRLIEAALSRRDLFNELEATWRDPALHDAAWDLMSSAISAAVAVMLAHEGKLTRADALAISKMLGIDSQKLTEASVVATAREQGDSYVSRFFGANT